MTFSNIDIVQAPASNPSGINTTLLGLHPDNVDAFMTYLNSMAGSENFYYNVPVDNSIHLDIDTSDEYSWFNYNNISNKFVLSEIDTDLSEIEIAKSSRLGK